MTYLLCLLIFVLDFSKEYLLILFWSTNEIQNIIVKFNTRTLVHAPAQTHKIYRHTQDVSDITFNLNELYSGSASFHLHEQLEHCLVCLAILENLYFCV